MLNYRSVQFNMPLFVVTRLLLIVLDLSSVNNCRAVDLLYAVSLGYSVYFSLDEEMNH